MGEYELDRDGLRPFYSSEERRKDQIVRIEAGHKNALKWFLLKSKYRETPTTETEDLVIDVDNLSLQEISELVKIHLAMGGKL